MTSFFTPVLAMLLSGPVGLTTSCQSAQVPFYGKVRIAMSIVKGAELGVPGKVNGDLDGTVVSIGRSSCRITGDRCVLQKVPAGTHAPSIELSIREGELDYRYVGTSAGPVVRMRRNAAGALVIEPHGTNTLVLKLERFPKGGSSEPIVVPAAASRAVGPIEAVAALISGMEFAESGFLEDARPLSGELDGTVVELGPSHCTLKNNKCTLENVSEGSHVSGIVLKFTSEKNTYRFAGTSTGPLSRVVKSSSGRGVELLPYRSNKLVFKFSRTRTNDNADPALPVRPAQEYAAAAVRQSLTVHLWLHIVDDREGVAYARMPLPKELKGVRLRLGKTTCEPVGATCTFPSIADGEYRLEAEFRQNPRYRLSLDGDYRSIRVVLDPWSKRPKVHGWKDAMTITLEKRILLERK